MKWTDIADDNTFVLELPNGCLVRYHESYSDPSPSMTFVPGVRIEGEEIVAPERAKMLKDSEPAVVLDEVIFARLRAAEEARIRTILLEQGIEIGFKESFEDACSKGLCIEGLASARISKSKTILLGAGFTGIKEMLLKYATAIGEPELVKLIEVSQ